MPRSINAGDTITVSFTEVQRRRVTASVHYRVPDGFVARPSKLNPMFSKQSNDVYVVAWPRIALATIAFYLNG